MSKKMEFIADTKKYDGSTPLKRIKFEKFIQWYIKTNNVTLSAVNAGYPQATAAQKGSTIKAREDVTLRYNYLMSKLADEKLWCKQKILEKIQTEAEATNNKPWERIKALELLGRSKALFIDKIKHSGKIEGQTQANIFVTDKATANELRKITGGSNA
jgi:phage terminase small subunit